MAENERCSEDRIPDWSGWHFYQCSRKATVEEDGKPWCWQHSPFAVRKRQTKSTARFNAETKRRNAPYEEAKRLRAVNAQLVEALEETAQYLKRLSQSQMGVDKPFAAHLADRAAKLFALFKKVNND